MPMVDCGIRNEIDADYRVKNCVGSDFALRDRAARFLSLMLGEWFHSAIRIPQSEIEHGSGDCRRVPQPAAKDSGRDDNPPDVRPFERDPLQLAPGANYWLLLSRLLCWSRWHWN
jgi:hypothetical protein